MTIRTPECKCLDCGHLLTAATDPTDNAAVPSENDITICLWCGHLMAFQSDMTVRELTSDEMYAVAGNKEILRIQAARGKVMKGK